MTMFKVNRSSIIPFSSSALLFGLRCYTCSCKSCPGGRPGTGQGSKRKPPQGPGASEPPSSTLYIRKMGHELPTDSVCPCFEVLPDIPTGIFRCTIGEVLGRGAGKCTFYQNPEYFSFHHMSFYDLHLHLRKYRCPCPKSGRKPV